MVGCFSRNCLASYAFCAIVALTSAGGARAACPEAPADPDTEARAAFVKGRDAYDRGAFDEALVLFECAHGLSPRSALLFNIGRAADSDGQASRAIAAYSAYLEAFPDAANREFVRARLTKMQELAKLSEAASTGPTAPLPSVAASVTREPEPVLTTAAPDVMPDDERARARPHWKRAWFWSAIGAVVVGGAAATALAATRERGPERANGDAYVTTREVGR